MGQSTLSQGNVCTVRIKRTVNNKEAFALSKKKKFYDNLYSNPFQNPRASIKRAFGQVKGETQQTQSAIILENQTRKRS
jgi:hypothetical protein